MGTRILRFTPPRHPVLELQDTCPGGLTRVRSPGPFRSLQRHRKANLGVMQRQSVPPAGFHFAGLCIAYYKFVALVRNRPLGHGNRAIQPYVTEVGANRSRIKRVARPQEAPPPTAFPRGHSSPHPHLLMFASEKFREKLAKVAFFRLTVGLVPRPCFV